MPAIGIQTTSNLTNARWAKYLPEYLKAAMFSRVYDAFGKPVPGNMSDLYRHSSIVMNFLSDLEPATATIPEDQDVSPVSFRDATVTITPTSRYNAIQVSELLMNSAGTNYASERFTLLGKNMMESVDLLAQAAADNARGFGVEDLRLISMFDKRPPRVDLLVIDEAQHDGALSMANLHSFIKPKKILGLSATPFRGDRFKLCFEKSIALRAIRCW